MNKQKLLILGQIALPAVCAVAGYLGIMRQIRRANEARAERTRIERQISIVDIKLKELEKPRPFIRYPAAVSGPQEQPEFLNTMRAYSAASRVTIQKWLSQAPIAAQTAGTGQTSGSALAAQQQQNPAAALAGMLPPGVTAIPAAVQVSGPYNNVRQFLYMVLGDRRLINLSDLHWTRTEKWPATGVEFTLTRYVSDRPPAMLAAQMAALNAQQQKQQQQQVPGTALPSGQGPLSSQTQGTNPTQTQTTPSQTPGTLPVQKQATGQPATITTAARTGN